MDTREIISVMSDDDALLALQAARADDIEGSKAAGTIVDAENG